MADTTDRPDRSPDREDLSQENTEKLLQFQDLTGIEDIQRCQQILASHHWNIESAVHDRFSDEDNDAINAATEGHLGVGHGDRLSSSVDAPNHQPSSPPPPSAPPLPTSSSSSSGLRHRPVGSRAGASSSSSSSSLRRPYNRLGIGNDIQQGQSASSQLIFHTAHRRRHVGWWEWSKMLVTFPIRFLYATVVDLLNFVWTLLRPDARRMVTDPIGDVVKFVSEFEAIYGPQHPRFFMGSYSQVLDKAKSELRFLIIYLHSGDHQDVDKFCQETLGQRQLVDFINSHALFWACSVKLPEGYRVSQTIREMTYPFVALAMLRENRMTIVARFHGAMSGDFLRERLANIMANNEHLLVAARQERHERSRTEEIRNEQDEAFEDSLKKDREKLKVLQEQREREQQEAEEKTRGVEERERKRKELEAQIPPEPDLAEEDTIKVVLKLPSGQRLERRFLRTQSLKYLYYYVFCNDLAPNNFQIIKTFPRQEVMCAPTAEQPEPPTFSEGGFGRAEMLYVQDNDA